jgi:hypothetical protein
LAEGESFNIDQDRAVVQIKCPQDEIIIKLNAELNKTYLWYGAKEDRHRYADNQKAQDDNASSIGSSTAASRASIKAGGAYKNVGRDLVDAMKEDKEVLNKVKSEDLPDNLKDKTPEEREAYVKELTAKRAEIQKQINALSIEREAHLVKERQRAAAPSGNATLGEAVASTINKQLEKSGFESTENGK